MLPAHPRTCGRLCGAAFPEGVQVIPPLGYLDFIALEASARLVLTDSGGVQEETTMLGVPCLTLRDNTERPITVTEGTNRLVGRDPDRIVAAAREVIADRGDRAGRLLTPRPGRSAIRRHASSGPATVVTVSDILDTLSASQRTKRSARSAGHHDSGGLSGSEETCLGSSVGSQ